MQDNPFENQYQNWLNNKKPITNHIPHIIHHIWLGSKLPEKYKPFLDSFRKHNPDWKMILWNEESILNITGFRFAKQFKKISNYGTKSDIARYEILRLYGGFYFDTDFECLKPLDDIADCSTFVSGIQFYDKPEFGNAMIASSPDTFLINEICNKIKPTNTTDTLAIINTTGPRFITSLFRENLDKIDSSVAFLPAEYFFAVPNSESQSVASVKSKYITPNTYGIHYWEQSWFQNDIFHRCIRKINKLIKK